MSDNTRTLGRDSLLPVARGLITADAFINQLPAERSGHVDDVHNAAESSRYYLTCIKLYPHVSMLMRQGLPGLRHFLITKF
jgi:hypothetical protein